MQRVQAVVLASVIAVLFVIGISFWSGGTGEDDATERASRSRFSAEETDGPRVGDARSARSGRGGPGPASGRLRGGAAAELDGPRGERGGPVTRGGRAGVVRGGGESRLSSLTGEALRRSERSRVALGAGSAVRGGPAAVGESSHKSAVLDTIAAVPKEQPRNSRGLEPLDPDAEVVLTVSNKEDTEPASEVHGVEEDPETRELKFKEDTVLRFPDAGNASGDAGTMSLDITPDWEGPANTNHSLAQIQHENQWANRIELVKNGRFLRFIIADDGGKETDISYPLDAWQAGEQHRVTATWGDGQTQLYIDGQLVGENRYPGKINIPSGVPLSIGSPLGNYSGANATMSNIQLSRTKYNGEK